MGVGLWLIGNALPHTSNFIILVIQISLGLALLSPSAFHKQVRVLSEGFSLAKAVSAF